MESIEASAKCHQSIRRWMFDNGQIDYLCSKMSAMPVGSKKTDRRASRTRRALSDALIGLILEKRYNAITVQDVIDRANVSRSTFYAHFRDKEDLFLSGWERLLEGFARHVEWENVGEARFVPLRELFQHVQEFHSFYMALARSRKTDLIYKTGLGYLSKGIEKSLSSWLEGKPPTRVPIPVLSNFLVSEMFGLLRWWLDQHMPYTPERMDEMFHQLIAPGLRSALGVIDDEANRKVVRDIRRSLISHAPHSSKRVS
jgi:AcrR family transcriptional regulator